MTTTTTDPIDTFEQAVAAHRLRTNGSRSDKPLLVAGALLMAAGVIGAFIQYNVSLAQDDSRDILSQLVLTVVMIGLTIVGAVLFAVGSLTRVLRLWLLRQLVENHLSTGSPLAASPMNENADVSTVDGLSDGAIAISN
jgi:hypothetical protein